MIDMLGLYSDPEAAFNEALGVIASVQAHRAADKRSFRDKIADDFYIPNFSGRLTNSELRRARREAVALVPRSFALAQAKAYYCQYVPTDEYKKNTWTGEEKGKRIWRRGKHATCLWEEWCAVYHFGAGYVDGELVAIV